MQFLVIDDEQLAVNRIKRLLEELHYSNITTSTSVEEGIKICKYKHFDVIFLDINMPGKNGLEAAKDILIILPQTHIIFTTAFDEYAIESYKIGAIDYLMKPISKEDIQISLTRVIKYLSGINDKPLSDITIVAKYHDKVALLKADEIYYFSAELNDTIAKTKDFEYYTHKKISDFNVLTQNQKFVKVHRSYIVNINKISYLEAIEQGKYCIYFKEIDEVIYSSRNGAQQLRDIFHDMI
ncbi:MAG: LytTR family DNA-binding domain-containing protein [Campylobacterota bacterium]|nr:LytTR family DNA-binding domain-containing protein [Campylobacterota bacterium]